MFLSGFCEAAVESISPLRRSFFQHKHLYSMFRSKDAFQHLFIEGPHVRIHLRSGLGKMEILKEGEKLDNCEKTLQSAVPGDESGQIKAGRLKGSSRKLHVPRKQVQPGSSVWGFSCHLRFRERADSLFHGWFKPFFFFILVA